MKIFRFLLGIFFVISTVSCGSRQFEEACSFKPMEQCRMDLDLICEDSICTCKENAFYDQEQGACVALIGQSCTSPDVQHYYYGGEVSNNPITRCPTDAVCVTRDPNKTPVLPPAFKQYEEYFQRSSPFRTSYSSDGTHKCFCREGFYADDDKEECIEALRWGQNCTANKIDKCDYGAGLTCDDEDGGTDFCVCADVDTYYDQGRKRCLTRVGGNCTAATSHCAKNSVCSTDLAKLRKNVEGIYRHPFDHRDPYTTLILGKKKVKEVGKCICLPGYSLNPEGNCVASFGVACSDANPCNSAHHLDCIDGVCQCQAGAHQVFSPANGNGTCKLLANSACASEGAGAECVNNAKCTDGICKCTDGHIPSPSGQCLPGYGAECHSFDSTNITDRHGLHRYREMLGKEMNHTCNFYQGLACRANKCECFDSSLTWDEKRSICVAGENEKCGPIKVQGQGFESEGQFESIYPRAYLIRPLSLEGGFSYYVACKDKFKCTKHFHGVDKWHICISKDDTENERK